MGISGHLGASLGYTSMFFPFVYLGMRKTNALSTGNIAAAFTTAWLAACALSVLIDLSADASMDFTTSFFVVLGSAWASVRLFSRLQAPDVKAEVEAPASQL